jgi:hypothetical protein
MVLLEIKGASGQVDWVNKQVLVYSAGGDKEMTVKDDMIVEDVLKKHGMLTAVMVKESLESPAKKKRSPGRPRKDGLPTGSPPACEVDELKRYPNPSGCVVWGIQPEHPKFKRKGLAILYNPEHPGGQVTLMPVTDDGGELRWRYRFIKGFCPYRYEKIDLEPGQAAGVPKILRAIADSLESGVKQWFGGQKEADQTTVDFHAQKKQDNLGDKLKKAGIF